MSTKIAWGAAAGVPRGCVDMGFRTLFSTPNRFIQYGTERQKEARAAATRLGLRADDVVFLGYPDRGQNVLDDVESLRPPPTPAGASGADRPGGIGVAPDEYASRS